MIQFIKDNIIWIIEGIFFIIGFIFAHNLKKRETQIKEKDHNLKERETQIKEKDHELKERETQIKEKDHELKERETQIKEKDHELKERETQIKEKDHELKERETQIKEKDYELKERETQIKEKDYELKERETVIKEKDHELKKDESKTKKFNEEKNFFKENEKEYKKYRELLLSILNIYKHNAMNSYFDVSEEIWNENIEYDKVLEVPEVLSNDSNNFFTGLSEKNLINIEKQLNDFGDKFEVMKFLRMIDEIRKDKVTEISNGIIEIRNDVCEKEFYDLPSKKEKIETIPFYDTQKNIYKKVYDEFILVDEKIKKFE